MNWINKTSRLGASPGSQNPSLNATGASAQTADGGERDCRSIGQRNNTSRQVIQ